MPIWQCQAFLKPSPFPHFCSVGSKVCCLRSSLHPECAHLSTPTLSESCLLFNALVKPNYLQYPEVFMLLPPSCLCSCSLHCLKHPIYLICHLICSFFTFNHHLEHWVLIKPFSESLHSPHPPGGLGASTYAPVVPLMPLTQHRKYPLVILMTVSP